MDISDGADAPYWNGLAEGKLLLPRCTHCGHWQWPAGLRCTQCEKTDMRWEERAMTATIFSWTRTWHRFDLTESLDLPFVSIVASVDDCGVRLLGRLDDPDQVDPAIGQSITGRIGATRVLDRDIPTIIWSRAS